LTTLMPTPKVLAEIESGFSDTLIKLLVQFNNDGSLNQNNKHVERSPLKGTSINILKNQLSIKSVREAIPASGAIEHATCGSSELNALSFSAPLRSPPENHLPSDRVSITSRSSSQDKSSSTSTPRFIANLEDKKQLKLNSGILPTKEVTTAITVNKTFSLFAGEGASRKLHDINHQVVSGVSVKNVATPVKSNSLP
ncbi:299_t:CDS:2, partial [Racocetra fulgida]